jgi:hypothetical protein
VWSIYRKARALVERNLSFFSKEEINKKNISDCNFSLSLKMMDGNIKT